MQALTAYVASAAPRSPLFLIDRSAVVLAALDQAELVGREIFFLRLLGVRYSVRLLSACYFRNCGIAI